MVQKNLRRNKPLKYKTEKFIKKLKQENASTHQGHLHFIFILYSYVISCVTVLL